VEKRSLHDTVGINDGLKAIIERAIIDTRFQHNDIFRGAVVDWTQDATAILDVGKSMRDHYDRLPAGATETLDINDFGDYPDILGDICSTFPPHYHGHYDAVIALAILEHVYDPQAAVEVIHSILKPGGTAYLYVPFLFRYHGPPDLSFQDYHRFSRDGFAYLLRNFETVTLYPVRGRFSTAINLFPFWKRKVEARFGGRINKWLDRFARPRKNLLQASGYYAVARKAPSP